LSHNAAIDGGFSGGNTERPDLQRLLQDVRAGKIDVIVVDKVDRLTRSLADFAKLVVLFARHNVSFVSVTQQFNTTNSMGRLTLNVLLSFAQFERELTSERIRDAGSPQSSDRRAASSRYGRYPFSRAEWSQPSSDCDESDRREVYRRHARTQVRHRTIGRPFSPSAANLTPLVRYRSRDA
jgi:DNA invertase Pin-like site-specific DNA recombinase